MAWRIEKHVVRGLIQNIVPGRVVGTVWLEGMDQPLELNLKGNGYRDIAGARLEFRNPNPIKGDYSGLDIFQEGTVGDMTASKKVKTLVDPDNYIYKGETPPAFTWANCLYLEWFSESNGRVLIETVDFKWKVSLPKWSLSAEAELEQQEANRQAMFKFMDELASVLDPDDDEEDELSDEEEMDEFQWEAYLQKSDARSDMLMELLEKYQGDPRCQEIISEAMGWDIESIEISDAYFEGWDALDRDPDTDPAAVGTEEATEEDDDSDDDSDYFPNHPLITSMMDITSRLFYEAESRNLLNDDNSNPWNQLVWHGQMSVSKLIAALEPVAEGLDAEPGFVVATLKRALHLIHLTIATLEACRSHGRKHRKWTLGVRGDLFRLRESVLDLMQHYRLKGE